MIAAAGAAHLTTGDAGHDRITWQVELGDDDPRAYRQHPEINVTGRLDAADPVVRRRDLLSIRAAIAAAQSASVPIHWTITDQVVAVVGGVVDGIEVIVCGSFADRELPAPADPALPFADQAVWPAEACPSCGALEDTFTVDDGLDAWECDMCGHQWATASEEPTR